MKKFILLLAVISLLLLSACTDNAEPADVDASPAPTEAVDTEKPKAPKGEAAADIWHGLEQEKPLDAIAADLVEKYDGIDQAAALEHVRKTVNMLIDAGIVEE